MTHEPDRLSVALASYSTKPRGGVVHTLSLAEALAARGHDVTVWTLGRGGDQGFFRPVDDRVRVRIVPFPEASGESVGERILRSIAVLGAAFDPAAYDIVHTQDCISANAVGRCIRTVHHLDRFTTPELIACHERAIVEPYALVCVSRSVADELVRGWGRRPSVIANGVDYDRFAAAGDSSPAAAARRAGWRRAYGRYVVTVGGIEPRKGSLDLLEAMALLRRQLPDVSLVVAGGETLFDYRDYRAAWDERAAELGVDPVVLGLVDEDELPSLVAAAAAFAFPSVQEGFGLAPMEALAAGVPLVTSDLPVLQEVFGATALRAGSVEALADALTSAVLSPLADARETGRALARTYTWSAAAIAHEALYRRLMHGSK